MLWSGHCGHFPRSDWQIFATELDFIGKCHVGVTLLARVEGEFVTLTTQLLLKTIGDVT